MRRARQDRFGYSDGEWSLFIGAFNVLMFVFSQFSPWVSRQFSEVGAQGERACALLACCPCAVARVIRRSESACLGRTTASRNGESQPPPPESQPPPPTHARAAGRRCSDVAAAPTHATQRTLLTVHTVCFFLGFGWFVVAPPTRWAPLLIMPFFFFLVPALTATMTALNRATPVAVRGQVNGVSASASAIASALGLPAGGWLYTVNWRYP